MTSKSSSKRGRGRPPKKKVFTPAELHLKATECMRKSLARRQSSIDFVDAENVVSLMESPERLQTLTSDEVVALREEASKLWEMLGYESDYNSEHLNPVSTELTDDDFLSAPAAEGQMSRKDWIEAHAFLKPKRKNARMPKSIRDIRKSKYEAYGLTDEKPEPIDHAALEADLQNQMMDRACEELAEAKRKQGHVGKRLRQPVTERRQSQVDTSKFWT